MYDLLYHPRAEKNLKRLHPIDQKRILAKLEALSKNPRDPSLDVRRLANTQHSFRLRSGDLRAIFEVDTKKRVIYIWDIDYRGSIY